jgi:AcrR family transcriptional regulator
MTPPPPRPREPRAPGLTARQEEIVDAAIAEVREEGWASLTVRRLADRLGVTDPALYRHFAGKGALVLAIADRMESLLLPPIRAIAAEPGTPPRSKIERILGHHVDLILATDGLPVLLISEAATGDARMAERLRGIMGEYMAILAGLIAGLTEGADAPPPQETLLQLLGLPAVVAIQRRLMPDRALADEAVRALVVRHVRQVLPRPAPQRNKEKP